MTREGVSMSSGVIVVLSKPLSDVFLVLHSPANRHIASYDKSPWLLT